MTLFLISGHTSKQVRYSGFESTSNHLKLTNLPRWMEHIEWFSQSQLMLESIGLKPDPLCLSSMFDLGTKCYGFEVSSPNLKLGILPDEYKNFP